MSQTARLIVESKAFQGFMIFVILAAGLLVGLETNREFVQNHAAALHFLDQVILWIFVVEIAFKLAAEGKKPWRFFADSWNVFDFLIVAVCFLPLQSQFVAVLRLARILRILKLVTALPQLQLIVGALLKSIPSISYVGILLGIHFYIFSVLATFLFGGNDPVRFGGLAISALTLFQIVTLEGWAEIMHIQMRGCDQMGYEGALELCTKPETMPIVAPIFFIAFIVTGTMIILNLFIGVIMNGMEEVQLENARRDAALEKASLATHLTQLSSDLAAVQDKLQMVVHHLPEQPVGVSSESSRLGTQWASGSKGA